MTQTTAKTSPPSATDKAGFVEFDLWLGKGDEKTVFEEVVCFSSHRFGPCAVEIIGDAMPETWCEGYSWDDLNILFEAFHRRDSHSRKIVHDLYSLKSFIRAFGWPASEPKVFMHVWRSRLPGGAEACGIPASLWLPKAIQAATRNAN